jgi:kinesin family protein 5
VSSCRFEIQFAAIKERLEVAKAGSTNGLGSPSQGAFSFGSAGSRIAKPLRGGGGGGSTAAAGAGRDGPVAPTISSLQSEGQGPKRSSWFFNKG